MKLGLYVKALEDALAALPCVVGPVLSGYDDTRANELVALTEPLARLMDGGAYPDVPFGRLQLRMTIAPADQQRLLGSRLTSTFTELFAIDLRYAYHSPVAIVECVAPSRRPMPSEAVKIVREALDEALQEASSFFRVDVLGPSPFHADFSLASSPSSRIEDWWDFDVETFNTRAYDEYRFYYNEEVFPDPLMAREELLDGLVSELDFFYRVRQVEARKRRQWDRLDTLTWTLVDTQRRGGIPGFAGRLLRSTRELDEAFIALAEFEGTNTLIEGVLRADFNDTYAVDEPVFLQIVIEEEMATQQRYPSSQSESLLKLFESRRLKSRELLVLIVAALIGGLAGGLLTSVTARGTEPSTAAVDAATTAVPPPLCAPHFRFAGRCPVTPPGDLLTHP